MLPPVDAAEAGTSPAARIDCQRKRESAREGEKCVRESDYKPRQPAPKNGGGNCSGKGRFGEGGERGAKSRARVLRGQLGKGRGAVQPPVNSQPPPPP
eukprot:SAG22_NODE_143_length_17909_cov_34.254969_10_plen_98_part_00